VAFQQRSRDIGFFVAQLSQMPGIVPAVNLCLTSPKQLDVAGAISLESNIFVNLELDRPACFSRNRLVAQPSQTPVIVHAVRREPFYSS
jgi:hypothetical protein